MRWGWKGCFVVMVHHGEVVLARHDLSHSWHPHLNHHHCRICHCRTHRHHYQDQLHLIAPNSRRRFLLPPAYVTGSILSPFFILLFSCVQLLRRWISFCDPTTGEQIKVCSSAGALALLHALHCSYSSLTLFCACLPLPLFVWFVADKV